MSAEQLKRGDLDLLRRVVKSNGGGVDADIIPRAQRERLERLGLIRWKSQTLKRPENRLTTWGKVVHTREGLALLQEQSA